jgi:hypothetical protein
MLRVGLASVADADKLWPRLSAGFGNACKRCESAWTAGELWQLCRSGNAFLILVYDDDKIWSAGVWRFETARPGVCFRCVMMYGHNMHAWLGMAREFIEKLAKENGAKALVAEGRTGWGRIFNATKTGRDYEVTI